MAEGFTAANQKGEISLKGVFNSLPLIIFGFMYQINVPALYTELKERNLGNIYKVLMIGTLMACVCYVIAGVFGFVSFAATPDEVGPG
jgi:amino acid permease